MKQSVKPGFTIVELLIVIIVIGILSTIVAVSYIGATTNANNNQAVSNANVVKRKIEAYASATGSYPADTTYTAYTTSLNSLSDSTLSGTGITLGATSSTNPTYIKVSQCTAPASYKNGMAYKIEYYNYTTKAISTTFLTNSLNSAAACSTWTALT